MNHTIISLAIAGFVLVAPQLVHAEETRVCTQQYQPVCGAKQVECIAAPCYPQYHTYGNSCTLAAEEGTFIHDGACTADETGPVKPTEAYTPPAGCVAWFDGCNSCSRQGNGPAACTLKACIGATGPGRCTAYANQAPAPAPEPSPIHSGVMTSPVPATPQMETPVTATTSAPAPESFVSRIWHAVLSWFSWIG